jgi:uncharacterized protein involved in exopolysaccharide biosynthesis
MVAQTDDLIPDRSQKISLAAVAGVLFRSVPWIIACAAIALVISLGVALFEARQYTAHVSFVPQGHRMTGAGGGLAAQLGIGSGGGDAGQSPPFYVELIGTREILRRVATANYSVGSRQGPLAAILGSQTPKTAQATDDAIDFLRGTVHVGLSQPTGVVTVNVTTENPTLSAQIASYLLEGVDAFNRENARAQATQQRDFTQQRLNEFRDELRLAEANLQEYLQRNRDAATASEAAFQRERLAREVGLRQQLYVTVTQAFEQARMEEARDAPQITTIERAEAPLRADRRGFLQKGLLGALLGALFAVVAIILREILEQAQRNDAAWYAEWEAARKRAPATRGTPHGSNTRATPGATAEIGDSA